MVKPDVVMLVTVPEAPPAAGPDRALDPLPPAVVEEDAAAVEGDVAFAEGDVAQPAKSAITAHIDAAATIHLLLGFDSNRRAFMMAFLLLSAESVSPIHVRTLWAACASSETIRSRTLSLMGWFLPPSRGSGADVRGWPRALRAKEDGVPAGVGVINSSMNPRHEVGEGQLHRLGAR
jgi:hypothetical protein